MRYIEALGVWVPKPDWDWHECYKAITADRNEINLTALGKLREYGRATYRARVEAHQAASEMRFWRSIALALFVAHILRFF